METTTQAEPDSGVNGWQQVALALLGGTVAFNVLAFHAVAVGNPKLGPPSGMAPVFVFVIVFGVTAYPLLSRDNTVGYAVAGLVGALAIAGAGLYLAESFGPAAIGPGPVALVALGSLVVIATVGAWRNRTTAGSTSPSAPTSQ
jgi:hypothetical protein